MTIINDIMLIQRMYGESPAAQPYLNNCFEAFHELEADAHDIEIGICTCAWLFG